MKGIYYDGSIEGQAALAKAARGQIPPDAGPVRLRDARAWLALPDGIEPFTSVSIPTHSDFDELAQLYADANAEVARVDLVDDAPTKTTKGDKKSSKKE